MYLGEHKEKELGRVAVIRFTDSEWDLYDFIADYENTYGDENREFFNGRVFGVERDENGVTINEAYIDVDDFDDFNDFKANYKEAKKEFKSLKKQATETKPETATDSETAETEATETEYTTEKELEKLEKELIEPEDTHIEDIKKFKEKSELNTNYGVLADEKFHQLTKTIIKSLFKAIGIQDTRKISFTISNGLVFFNYNGMQYKYYPSQCKVFKKCGRKYQRINWKDFAEENNPDGQNQKRGRSPPFTPDIRSINKDKFKIKE